MKRKQEGRRLVNVVVTDIGPQVISFVRALRETSMFINLDDKKSLPKPFQENGFGLKECKDFTDSVRYVGEQILLLSINEPTAAKFQRHLQSIGAKVALRDDKGRCINTPWQETGSTPPITMPGGPLTVAEPSLWLKEQELLYASAQGTGGVRIRLLYRVGSQEWVVYLGGVLYQGPDLEKAVALFNEHSY